MREFCLTFCFILIAVAFDLVPVVELNSTEFLRQNITAIDEWLVNSKGFHGINRGNFEFKIIPSISISTPFEITISGKHENTADLFKRFGTTVNTFEDLFVDGLAV